MSKSTKTIVGIFITLLFFGLLISLIIAVKIKESDAYLASQKYIENNNEVLGKVGEIEGYSFFTFGSIESSQHRGEAFLQYTVKGSKGNTDLNIVLEKDSINQWVVVDIWISD